MVSIRFISKIPEIKRAVLKICHTLEQWSRFVLMQVFGANAIVKIVVITT